LRTEQVLLVLEQAAKEYGLMVVMREDKRESLGPLIVRSLNVLGISSEDGLSFHGTNDCE